MPAAANPVAIVTGSSRGIGRAIACQLARDGYHVVVNYLHSQEAAGEVVSQVEALGRRTAAVQADVACIAQHQQLIDAAEALGSLCLLVNNAGITSPGRRDLLEATEANWDSVMGTNLKGPFFLAQAAARQMCQAVESERIDAGCIINISSISALAASTNRVDYCIAKSALQMMTWLLAERLAEHRICVHEICPGVIESDMTAPVRDKYDQLIADGLSPIRRWGTPQDVADAVSLLASGRLSFSTGERLHVDGGFHIRRL